MRALPGMALTFVGISLLAAGCGGPAAEAFDPNKPSRAVIVKHVGDEFGEAYHIDVTKFELSPVTTFHGTTMKPHTFQVDALCSCQTVQPLYGSANMPARSPFGFGFSVPKDDPQFDLLRETAELARRQEERWRAYVGDTFRWRPKFAQATREKVISRRPHDEDLPTPPFHSYLIEKSPAGRSFTGKLSYLAIPDLDRWKFEKIHQEFTGTPEGRPAAVFADAAVVGSPKWNEFQDKLKVVNCRLKERLGQPLGEGLSRWDFQETPVRLGNRTFTIEIAYENWEATKALAGRDELPSGRGMVIVSSGRVRLGPQGDWSKTPNTFPVDLVSVDAKGKVAEIKVMNPADALVVFDKPVQWVFELHRGDAADSGVKIGDTVAIPLFDQK